MSTGVVAALLAIAAEFFVVGVDVGRKPLLLTATVV
jgi:hypothetical protein